MGLFEEIWNWMKSLVQGLINKSLATFKYWVNAAIKAAIDAVDWVVTNIYKTYETINNYLTEYVTNVTNVFKEYITNVTNEFNEYVTNVTNEFNEYVTNVTNIYKEYTTNIYGVTEDVVRNLIKLSDPFGFLKDPMGYIKAAFNVFINPWGHGIVKSFGEGFEEGLEE